MLNFNEGEQNVGMTWYQKDETELALEDLDVSEVDMVRHSRTRLSADGKLTKAKAELLNKTGLEMGLIEKALPFPVINKKPPVDATWNKLSAASEGLMRLPKGDYVIKWQAGSIVEVDVPLNQPIGYSPSEFSALLADIASDDLKSHLKAGYYAVIFAKGGSVKWTTVPNYHLTEQWAALNEVFDREVDAFVELKEAIRRSEEFTAVLNQHHRLKDVPFAWFVGIKKPSVNIRGGGVSGNNRVSSVTHLVVDEHYKEGRLVRDVNDFYCTGRMSKENRATTDLTHTIMVDGDVVKKLPHLITCKTCNDRIDSLIEAVKRGA